MAKQFKVLVVDDEATMREVLQLRLAQWGFDVCVAASGVEAREAVKRERPDAVICDVVLPDVTGLELVRSLQEDDRDRPVVLITAHATVDTAVEAMKLGALDFITKPLDYEKLKSTLFAARRTLESRSNAQSLEKTLADGSGLGQLVGMSAPMLKVYDLLQTLAGSDAVTIFTGESGTGKELAARTVHSLSQRRDSPFIAVNTSAIPEGLIESELFGHEKGAFTGATGGRPGYFELADGGTLFLDEISEMPMALQPKLLRVLEDGRVRRVGGKREIQVDVRVLAATNRDPDEAMKEGHLRQDLYYRLSVFTVELPSLRQRRDDVPLIAQHFVRQFNDKHGARVVGVSVSALEKLRGYDWPGNARELRNVVERAVILAREGLIDSNHLPPYLREVEGEADSGLLLPTDVTVAEAEKILILDTLKRVRNNKSRAARLLGVDVKTIHNKLKSYADSTGR